MMTGLIPAPAAAHPRPGAFVIPPGLAVAVAVAGAVPPEAAVATLSAVLARPAPVRLRADAARADLGDEGYRLDIGEDTLSIEAAGAAGLFYGWQTLRQMLAAARGGVLPCGRIEDRPRFPWRGLMLDPARHFLPLPFLKRYIDLLAGYKFNRLHLHLTDDLGWTIEIRRYPELADMARWPMTPPGRRRGVYTQAELRELAAYAAARHVTLVPEIEMPGHNGVPGWLLRDRVLCPNNPWREPQRVWDDKETPHWVEPCLARPEAQAVYETILGETMDTFPGPYVHVGGDEYYGLAWAQCPDCSRLMEAERARLDNRAVLTDLFAKCKGHPEKYLLYRRLMARTCAFVTAHGRRPILWDDLSWRGVFPDGAVIMQWHYQGGFDHWQCLPTPENPAAEAAAAGHDAIIAPYSHLYFDLHSTPRDVHAFDPMPPGLAPQEQARILGPHAPVWEQPEAQVDARVFPRLYALAEIGWAGTHPAGWDAFEARAAQHEQRRARPAERTGK